MNVLLVADIDTDLEDVTVCIQYNNKGLEHFWMCKEVRREMTLVSISLSCKMAKYEANLTSKSHQD
jgi:hypothetical protein